MSGGKETVWGEVAIWEPPHRLVFTWHPGYEEGAPSTEIEVRFVEEDDSTRVVLEHCGWEHLGERGLELRPDYDTGWDTVLGLYADAAGRA